jgi:two-component system NtrC family response regulator
MQRQGRLEMAVGGTLFLDEIGELPLPLQVKLLRFLQDKHLERVGGRESIHIDVRVIAATNVDLDAAVKAGQFREDLFYRLAVVKIELPPLRERGEDLALLAQAFVRKYAALNQRDGLKTTHEAMRAISQHSWPGNVRELENKIKRAVIMAEGNRISPADLELAGDGLHEPAGNLKRAVQQLETQMVTKALRRHKGKVAPAAAELGISRPTLYEMMEKYGVGRETTES